MNIRAEESSDVAAVHALNTVAFGGPAEAILVDALRAAARPIVSLVAEDGGEVVGHILFSPVTVECSGEVFHGMGLAPMAVAPDHQHRGVGTALVETGLKQLSAAKCPFVVVIGHPEYYPRFGFVPASESRIAHGFAGIPQSVLFVRFFDSDIAFKVRDGIVHYRHEFGTQTV